MKRSKAAVVLSASPLSRDSYPFKELWVMCGLYIEYCEIKSADMKDEKFFLLSMLQNEQFS